MSGRDDDDSATSTSTEESNIISQANKLKVPIISNDVDVQVSDTVWLKERKCLLVLLQARMLLREMVEYRVKLQRIQSGNLSIEEIQNLLYSSGEYEGDSDFISDIQELKRQLAKEIRRNYALERELQRLEKKIALLIQNRTSIQEIDRELKRKKKKAEVTSSDEKKEDFTQDKKKMELYSNLFYLLQTEPKYLAKLLYLIPREKLLARSDNTDNDRSFLDTLLLSLYGDAFSPREEYLILQLFKLAITNEIVKLKSGPIEFIQSESVVPYMIITYNKRKQGVEYLKNTFGALIKEISSKNYVFELNATTVAQKMGTTNIGSVIESRVQQLQEVCQQCFEQITSSLSSMPYGLRLICKQLNSLCQERFPKAPKEDIYKVFGYVVYYRFMNLYITVPDSFETSNQEFSLIVRKNLIVIAKVMQKVFNFGVFGSNDDEFALNSWIQKKKPQVVDYFNELIDVPEPEDYLAINKYVELTQKAKPLIIITDREIIEMHRLVASYKDQLAPDPNDPLQILLKELGDIPRPFGEEERDIQLTLENRFKNNLEETAPEESLYEEAKELLIQIFKAIPIKNSTPQSLMSILKEATKYARDTNNKTLGKNISKVLKNIERLEEKNVISKKDRYASLLKDVALEVIHRAERREQQKKEIDRLTAALENLKKHGKYMDDQIKEFNKYLQVCRTNVVKKAKDKKKKPIKFTYKELVKKEVILSSDLPEISQNKTKLLISMPEIGKFAIEVQSMGLPITKLSIDLEELLELKDNNVPTLELEQVVLSVPNTLLLFNKEFLS
jgi:Ras GTPase-activating-like protein IQGAP2/3